LAEISLKIEMDERRFAAAFGRVECDKEFKTNSELKIHKKIHTGLKPYACSKCYKAFHQIGNLKTHKMTHTGENPYACSKCDKAFRTNAELKIHGMTHTGEKPFACSKCDFASTTKQILKTHERTHSSSWDNKEETLKNPATTMNNLVERESVFLAKMGFPCNKWDQAFYQNSALKRHERNHTAEKPYISVCGG
jgi:KRAB domain-containing zinc finger protein